VVTEKRTSFPEIDLSFLEWGGTNEIPLGIIFTKADKLSAAKVNRHVDRYSQELLKRWDELPPIFVTSSTQKKGRDEVLSFIEKALPRVTKK
ncbi:MAG TPA: YihA family ribosome biogenesis GTP-binding protein, partial [Cyclobacteriaceae bacterium]|nr:YihA family ribosome biogenesis GTP-binding protein [Cyclobacteriaceae bacterium]